MLKVEEGWDWEKLLQIAKKLMAKIFLKMDVNLSFSSAVLNGLFCFTNLRDIFCNLNVKLEGFRSLSNFFQMDIDQ